MDQMHFHRNWRIVGLVLVMTGLGAGLGGCVTPPTDPLKITSVPPSETLIVFNAADFIGAPPRRARFLDEWDLEEYARYESNGAVAEIIYSTTAPDAYMIAALDYPFTVDESIKTWNFPKRHSLQWGRINRVRADLTDFFYKPFQIVNKNRACFGFSSDWDFVSWDQELRSRKSIFGYYCAPAGVTLNNDQIITLLDQIGIIGITQRRRGSSQAEAKTETKTDPLQMAHGSLPNVETGNLGFPYRFADMITLDGGGDHS